MIRRGPWKFVHSPADLDQLYNLTDDPRERINLSALPEGQEVAARMRRDVEQIWDLPKLHNDIVQSQRRRRYVFSALKTGSLTAWDYQPVVDASRQYVRSHMDLDDVEAMARFPRP